MRKVTLTAAHLRERLDYDPLTGVFTWKYCPTVSKKANRMAGKVAGCSVSKSGAPYWEIRINNEIFESHRLAFLYMTEAFPEEGTQVDHIDGDGLNNKWANLRQCNKSQNQANSKLRRTNTSGFKGVCWHKQRQRWVANIQLNGRRISLGLHNTPEDAHAVYCAKAKELFGEFARNE
jgi:hypothetical protein